jgi:hypothetical protein
MSNRAKIREEVKKLNPIDDEMFRKMAENKNFCQEILRVILNDDKLIVIEAVPQWNGSNLQGRSVILDAKCIRGDGTQVDIEVQKEDNDDHQRRVRYNGAILTTNVSDTGTKFEKVPDVCVVYITAFDIFKGGHTIYHIDRVIRETKEVVENGFNEVYVNTEIKDGTNVSELMEIFVSDTVYNDKFPETSREKRRYKNSEGGIEGMSTIVENLVNEGRVEGMVKVLMNLADKGLITLQEAIDNSGLSKEEFMKITNELKEENNVGIE